MNTYNVKTAESVNLHFVAISEVPYHHQAAAHFAQERAVVCRRRR